MRETENILNFFQTLMQSNGIPLRRFVLPCDSLDEMDQGLRKTIFHIENLTEKMTEYLRRIQPQKLYFLTDSFQCSYMVFRLPESEEIIQCGPVTFEQFQGKRLRELLTELQIPPEIHSQMRDYYLHVCYISDTSYFSGSFLALAEWIWGKDNYEYVESNFGELNYWDDVYRNYFRIPDKPFLSIQMIEKRYEMENALISAVGSGNETRALELLSGAPPHFIPYRLNNVLRDEKDYCITLNTLLRKAVEDAGVHPIHIDSLSNQNVKNIEKLTSVDQCHIFRNDCIKNYCRLVRRYTMNQYSLLTQRVINYISTDLTADLSLKSLSELLSVNASYLSTLFKKDMGISLTDYVNHSRISLAQNLLLSTDLPIKDIAQRCGIPDVYYFSRIFKKTTDMTPKTWRDTQTIQRLHNAFHREPDI
ncbi:MAG: AraC family transcriptional regulator [Clostridiales bacterium]|nr:AraC family transcriptional regulator [Clostridiales bacterium]